MDIKSYRKKLGLTQQQLCEFLGIERSTLGMAEIGKRSLSIAALNKLTELTKCLHENENIYEPSIILLKEVEKQNEKARIVLKKHATKCIINATFLEQKLNRLQARFKTISSQINSLSNASFLKETKNKMWLDVLIITLLEKLERISIKKQVHLKLKISSLKFEAQCAIEIAEGLM